MFIYFLDSSFYIIEWIKNSYYINEIKLVK